jgi:hypothetical protein
MRHHHDLGGGVSVQVISDVANGTGCLRNAFAQVIDNFDLSQSQRTSQKADCKK